IGARRVWPSGERLYAHFQNGKFMHLLKCWPRKRRVHSYYFEKGTHFPTESKLSRNFILRSATGLYGQNTCRSGSMPCLTGTITWPSRLQPAWNIHLFLPEDLQPLALGCREKGEALPGQVLSLAPLLRG